MPVQSSPIERIPSGQNEVSGMFTKMGTRQNNVRGKFHPRTSVKPDAVKIIINEVNL